MRVMDMITPENKDIALRAIACHDAVGIILEYEEIFPGKEVSVSEAILILNQFEKIGLLRKLTLTRGIKGQAFSINPAADLYDFLNHGGFVVQEQILRANLEKLGYELEKLSKDIDPGLFERVETIAGIAASVATALNLFSH